MENLKCTDRELFGKRIPELDGLRGIAILMVVVWHYAAIKTQAGSLAAYTVKLLSFTWAGVDLFFVLSGFLIGGILFDSRKADNYFKVFYLRRSFRIFPLYYFVVILVLVGEPYFRLNSSPASEWLFNQPMPVWTYFLYLQNFAMAEVGTHGAHALGVTWSLGVEEQFYLILPLLVRFISPKRLPALLLVLILSAPIIRTVLYFAHPFSGFPGYVLLPGRWDSLFLGVLAAVLVRRERIRSLIANSQRQIVLTFWCLILGVGAMIAANQTIGSLVMSSVGHTGLAVMGLISIIMAMFTTSTRLRRFLCNPFLTFMGTISYGIYLYHQIVSGVVFHFLTDHIPIVHNGYDFLVMFIAFFVTIGIATISWFVMEKPILNLAHNVRYTLSRPAQLGPGASFTRVS